MMTLPSFVLDSQEEEDSSLDKQPRECSAGILEVHSRAVPSPTPTTHQAETMEWEGVFEELDFSYL